MKKKITHFSLIAILILFSFKVNSQYNAVSVQNLGNAAGLELEPAEIAGVETMPNWNQGVKNGLAENLLDNFGEATLMSASNTIRSNHKAWSDPSSLVDPTPDQKLMAGSFGMWDNTEVTLTIENIPEFITIHGYKIISYYQAHVANLNEPARIGIGDEIYYVLDPDEGWDGNFVQGTSTNIDEPDICSYVVFDNLTESNVTITFAGITANARGECSGFQVIGYAKPIETLSVTPLKNKVQLSFPELLKFESVTFYKKGANDAEFVAVPESDLSGTVDYNTTSIEILNLNNGEQYEFKMVVDQSPYHGESNVVSAIPVSDAVPISDLSAEAWGSGKVKLSFSAPSGATSVIVEKSEDDGSTWTEVSGLSLSGSSTEAVISDLDDEITYSFRLNVTGGDSEGISNEATAKPGVLDLGLNSVKGNLKISLNFTAPVEASSVKLYFKKSDETEYTEDDDTLTAESTIASVDVPERGEYNLKIEVQGGPYEGEHEVTEIAYDPINDLAATKGDGEVTLNFSAPSGATSVKALYKVNTDTEYSEFGSGTLNENSTDIIITGLNNGTRYDFRIEVEGGIFEGSSNIASATPNIDFSNVKSNVISINFMGDTTMLGAEAATVLPDEELGVVPARNWINIFNDISTRTTDEWFLVNEKGEQNGASLMCKWFQANRWGYNGVSPEMIPLELYYPEDKFMLGQATRKQEKPNYNVLEFYNLPQDFIDNGYDMIVYWTTYNSGPITRMEYFVGDKWRDQGMTSSTDTFALADNDPDWGGEFKLSTYDGLENALNDGSNYVRFENLTYPNPVLHTCSDQFEILENGVGGNGVCAIQLVKRIGSGINETNYESFKVYPTVADQSINLELNFELSSKASIQIINTLGQNVKSLELMDNQKSIDISELQEGIYFIRLDNGDKVYQSKVVKVE